MPKFYDNVKSRLNKKNIKGISKTEYERVANIVGVVDMDDATTEQIRAGVEYFENSLSSQISLATATVESEIVPSPDILSDELAKDETGSSEIAIRESMGIEVNNTSSIVSAAESMGVVLSESDIESVAASISEYSSDLTDSLADIRHAITQFIGYKYKQNRQDINSMLQSVRSSLDESNSQLTDELSEGLNGISDGISKSNNDFKSSVAKHLARFFVPF